MDTRNLRLTFQETMAGPFALGETDPRAGEERGKREACALRMHASIAIDDIHRFCDEPDHCGMLTGRIDFTPFGTNLQAETGVFNLFSPSDDSNTKLMIYEIGFRHQQQDYYVAGKKLVRDDTGFDLWSDTTTLFTTLHRGRDKSGPVIGAGILRLSLRELTRLVRTMTVPGAQNIEEKLACLSRFGRFFLGSLWDNYITSKIMGT